MLLFDNHCSLKTFGKWSADVWMRFSVDCKQWIFSLILTYMVSVLVTVGPSTEDGHLSWSFRKRCWGMTQQWCGSRLCAMQACSSVTWRFTSWTNWFVWTGTPPEVGAAAQVVRSSITCGHSKCCQTHTHVFYSHIPSLKARFIYL